MNREVTISAREYYYLKLNEMKLDTLDVNGVDNWDHYGCMCSELDEPECIFCTEDEEKFLGIDKD